MTARNASPTTAAGTSYPDRGPTATTPGRVINRRRAVGARPLATRPPGYSGSDRAAAPPWDLELETYQLRFHLRQVRRGGRIGSEPAESSHRRTVPGPFDVDDDREWHRLHNSFAAAVTAFDASWGSRSRVPGPYSRSAWIVSGFGWPLGEHGIVGPTGSRMHENSFTFTPGTPAGPTTGDASRADIHSASDLTPTVWTCSASHPRPTIEGLRYYR